MSAEQNNDNKSLAAATKKQRVEEGTVDPNGPETARLLALLAVLVPEVLETGLPLAVDTIKSAIMAEVASVKETVKAEAAALDKRAEERYLQSEKRAEERHQEVLQKLAELRHRL